MYNDLLLEQLSVSPDEAQDERIQELINEIESLESLLNLALNTLAALQAPVILMAQNRQAAKDRAVAQNDYQVNLKAELEIADLHRKIDELGEALTMQTKLVSALVSARRQELTATVRAMENVRRANGAGD
jgi:uncharacterized membrane protein